MEVGNSLLSAALLLFFVMDPFGNAPLAISLLRDVEKSRRRIVLMRELLIALGVLIFFPFFVEYMVRFMCLQQESGPIAGGRQEGAQVSLSIAGGIVLGFVGLRMLFPSKEGVLGHQVGGEPFIVPLAIPLIAGPSAMAMVIVMAKSNPGQMGMWFGALLLAWTATAVVMMASPLLLRVLRERGLTAIERLMGMVLIMLAVQMVINGISALVS